jgi:hypothetical protein
MKVKANSPLEALAILQGEWTMESPQFPGFMGRATVEWIEEGACLLLRNQFDKSDVPSSVWMVGGDDSLDDCAALYYDSRAVRRIYRMSLTDGIWRVWREAPQFNQRFFGELSSDGNTITARWEMSRDSSSWNKDFDLFYRRVS